MLPLVITDAARSGCVLVVMGAVGYGVYTTALVELGSRFKGTALVAGNAAFALMWGAGGIVGPPGAGSLMQVDRSAWAAGGYRRPRCPAADRVRALSLLPGAKTPDRALAGASGFFLGRIYPDRTEPLVLKTLI